MIVQSLDKRVIISIRFILGCPCSPMLSLKRPVSEEEILRPGEVSIRASAAEGCENKVVIRCSVADGLLPVLSYRLQGAKAGENTIGFMKDVEDAATCDSLTGVWMRTYDNNSAFSEFSCFAQAEGELSGSKHIALSVLNALLRLIIFLSQMIEN